LALDVSSVGFFLAGFFLGNGMPHFIFGRAGKIFRSPFGQRSKPHVNVMWGLANFVLATVIIAGLDILGEVGGLSLLGLLVGFWFAVLMFGLGIRSFLNDRTMERSDLPASEQPGPPEPSQASSDVAGEP
jgi:hypothetical protein